MFLTPVIEGIQNGYYEVTETSSPTGYVLSGNRTFYFRALNGTIAFLQREDEVAPAEWEATTTPEDGSNVLEYALATGADEGAAPATVTIGNYKGIVLPSSGSSAGIVLALMALSLCLAAAYSLWGLGDNPWHRLIEGLREGRRS